MAQLTISQVARRIRLRPSAIRYYERIGLLPPCGWRIVISPIFPLDPKLNVTLLHCDSLVFFEVVRDGCWPHFSSGQKIEMRLVHIFEMRDGKISKEIVFDMGRPV